LIRSARRAAAGALLVLVATAFASAQGLPRQERAHFALRAGGPAPPGGTARVDAVVTIDSGWHVNSHQPTYEYLIPTVISVTPPAGWAAARLEYPAGVTKKFGFADEPLSVYDGTVAIPIELDVPAGAQGKALVEAELRYQACDDRSCLPPVTTKASLELAVGSATAAAAAPLAPSSPTPVASQESAEPARGLVWMLLLAFVGGLILNAMPCVLPVLSLKIFGLVRSAGEGRARTTSGALATAAGIWVSFGALAAAAVAARAAGTAVGWGVQFQEPRFVAFLAVVVMLFSLNLWGLFEVPLPRRLASWADSGQGEGIAGHFASGLFATLMATPCSAPFLGPALGFALSQPPGVIFAVFAAVGLGMSAPYLLLAAAPGAARFLPRPGPWMETFKVAMGFLLAGAVVWLFYVLAAQVAPERLALVQIGLLALGLFGWLRHHRSQRGQGGGAAFAAMLAAAVFTVVMVRGANGVDAAPSRSASSASQLIAWVDWDRAQAESLAASGRMVFVDVTADWCFTCKVNERLILETPEIADAFGRHQVVAMRADWTNRNDTIARFLSEHGRAGIPFYMLYRPGREPKVFAELLSKDGLLREIESAASATAALPH
jgi:suppressor for copper-sensitivity B